MAIPDFQTLMRPVLKAFFDGATSVPETLPALIDAFHLTPEEVEERLPSGAMTVLANRAHWARTYMSKAGLLTSPKRGRHEITAKGREALVRFPGRIDTATLAAFDGFDDWRKASKSVHDAMPDDSPLPAIHDSLTPEDRLVAAFAEIEASLVSEVLEAAIDCVGGFIPGYSTIDAFRDGLEVAGSGDATVGDILFEAANVGFQFAGEFVGSVAAGQRNF